MFTFTKRLRNLTDKSALFYRLTPAQYVCNRHLFNPSQLITEEHQMWKEKCTQTDKAQYRTKNEQVHCLNS